MSKQTVSPGLQVIIEAAFIGAMELPLDRRAFLYRHLAEFCVQRERRVRFLELADAAQKAFDAQLSKSLDAQMTQRVDSFSAQ